MVDPDRRSPDEQSIRAAMRAMTDDDLVRDAPPTDLWHKIAGSIDEPHAVRARLHRTRWIVAAAAVVLLVVAGTAVLIRSRPEDSAAVVASASLSSKGLEGAPIGLLGSADVIDQAGREVLHVDVGDARPRSGEYLEVWLIKPDVSGLVSLGTVRPDGSYVVPPGLLLTDYPIVDVSTEPYDGNPSHSGDSLLRGTLQKHAD